MLLFLFYFITSVEDLALSPIIAPLKIFFLCVCFSFFYVLLLFQVFRNISKM